MRRQRIWLLVASLTALGQTRAAASEDDPPPPAPIPPPDEAPPDPAPPPDSASQPSPPRKPQRQKRVFLALPHVGMHSYQNWQKAFYGPGLRVGSLMGGRINDRISFNGELTYDVSNIDPALGDYRESSVSFALGPLWQLPAGPIEIVFGPKVGFFYTSRAATADVTEGLSTGWILGFNAGLFMPLSAATSIGVLLAYEFRGTVRFCSKQSGTESCFSGSGGEGVARLVGLTAALLL